MPQPTEPGTHESTFANLQYVPPWSPSTPEPGWRYFKCPVCALMWKTSTRNHHATGGETCRSCFGEAEPYKHKADNTLFPEEAGKPIVVEICPTTRLPHRFHEAASVTAELGSTTQLRPEDA